MSLLTILCRKQRRMNGRRKYRIVEPDTQILFLTAPLPPGGADLGAADIELEGRRPFTVAIVVRHKAQLCIDDEGPDGAGPATLLRRRTSRSQTSQSSLSVGGNGARGARPLDPG